MLTRPWIGRIPRRRAAVGLAAVTLALIAVFSFFLATGLASAFDARDQFQALQEDLSGGGLGDLREADSYRSLAEQFAEAEGSAGRARSRLRFAGWFTWLPEVGGRIRESRTQLSMAYFLARAGHGLAATYEVALAPTSGQVDGSAQSDRGLQVTAALEDAASVLQQVEQDLEKARLLRNELGADGLDSRYATLLDEYFPQIQTLTYISIRQPGVIAQGYELNVDLASVEGLVTDPIQVLASPGSVDDIFDRIIARSQVLTNELKALRQTIREEIDGSPAASDDILRTVELMMHAAALLEHSTAGAQGLLQIAKAAEADGSFSEKFAAATRPALQAAENGLLLAQVESAALRDLVSRQELDGDSSQSVLGFGNVTSLSAQSIRRVDDVLERAVESTRFMNGALGYNGPRNYLLLAQNQQEIRATGGFIGAAIRVTIDQGELTNVDFKDSTTVDLLPPAYPNNPLPPEPLYWYLWTSRLLFRDANWSPNFPTAVASVADVYRLGLESQVDGVLTGNKALLVDLVALLKDIRVPDLPDPLTRAEAQAYTDGLLPYQCSERHSSVRGKRCFDEDAFFAIKDRLTSAMSTQVRSDLIKLITDELSRGNVLAHIFDPIEGSLLWDFGWNGAIPPVDHDYLSVVDSSLPGHTAEGVRRQWEYQVQLREGEAAEARLRLHYNHTGEFQEGGVCRQSEPASYNCFWNYFRVYISKEAFNIVAPPVPLGPGSENLFGATRTRTPAPLPKEPTSVRPG